jgi:hypothetical protein
VARVVEIDAVGVAVDHRPHEAEVVHTAFEFVGCGAGILHGEMRKAAVAVRPPFYLFGQQIVSLPGALDCLRGIFLDLHAGARQRQHRERHAGRIHGGQPLVAEIREFFDQLIIRLMGDVRHRFAEVAEKIRKNKVLLKRDLAHAMAAVCR